MNASRIVSRATARSAGSPPVGRTLRSAIGSIHVASGSAAPSGPLAVRTAERSIGRARRSRPDRRSMQTLVAMR